MKQLNFLLLTLCCWLFSGGMIPTPENPDLPETGHPSCKHFTTWGSKQICLPEMEEMKDIYPLATAKQVIDQNAGQGNQILAYYIPRELVKYVEVMGGKWLKRGHVTHYFQIHAPKSTENVAAAASILDEVSEKVANQIPAGDWKQIEKSIANGSGSLKPGQQYLISKSTPNKDARSFSIIQKMQQGEKVKYILSFFNLTLVKDRMFWLVYFSEYNQKQSLKAAQKSNLEILDNWLDSNS